MRELKFRAWCKVSNAFVDDIIINVGKPINSETNNFLITQYTGLKDHNNTDIYENDILRHNGKIYYVEYIGGRYVLTTGKGFDTNNAIDLGEDLAYESQVIGNTNENPMLLK